MEMTKWFDTNYHYIVPFHKKFKISVFFRKIIDEYKEAKKLDSNKSNHRTRFLLTFGKEKQEGFHRMNSSINYPVYFEILKNYRMKT
jgi:hypothetical protein